MAHSCVVLLLDCVHFLSSDTAQMVESSPFWRMLKDGLTTSKWSTKFKTGRRGKREGEEGEGERNRRRGEKGRGGKEGRGGEGETKLNVGGKS